MVMYTGLENIIYCSFIHARQVRTYTSIGIIACVVIYMQEYIYVDYNTYI